MDSGAKLIWSAIPSRVGKDELSTEKLGSCSQVVERRRFNEMSTGERWHGNRRQHYIISSPDGNQRSCSSELCPFSLPLCHVTLMSPSSHSKSKAQSRLYQRPTEKLLCQLRRARVSSNYRPDRVCPQLHSRSQPDQTPPKLHPKQSDR